MQLPSQTFTADRRAHTDPIGYANRPLEAGYDEYQAVREHVARLVITRVGLKSNQAESSGRE